MKRCFTKEEIYEATRGLTGSWQERWYQYMGESVIITLSPEGFVNVIVLRSASTKTLPRTVYLKRGEIFYRLDDDVFERVRGEGEYVGKVKIPVSLQVEVSSKGVVGSIHERHVKTYEVGYTRRVERVVWVTQSAKFRISFGLQWTHVYGSEWEQVFQRVEEIKKEREREYLIELGRGWCIEKGLGVKNEEIYLHVGTSILEEMLEREKEEEAEITRLIWGGEDEEDGKEYDQVFYVGPDTAELKLKRDSFVYGMLELLFTGSPKVLLSYLSLD